MNKLEIRVPYADTDQMGMVYYANYFIYFERGRTELLRQLGLTYKELETKKLFFPVIDANCHYQASAKYDDLIEVRTRIAEIGGASVTFSYEIFLDDKILVRGHTKHPLVNELMRPRPIKNELRALLEKELEEGQ
jgi:acyl-CoA thioester hydrolase